MEQSSGWVVTTFDGLMDQLMPLADLKKQALSVENGQIIDVELWKKQLTQLGYERLVR